MIKAVGVVRNRAGEVHVLPQRVNADEPHVALDVRAREVGAYRRAKIREQAAPTVWQTETSSAPWKVP